MLSHKELQPPTPSTAPTLRNSVPSAVLTSHRMSEPYGRSLSPSFLDLTPSTEYHSPSDTVVTALASTLRVKRKGKPPPLILRDSFHSTRSQSPTSPAPPSFVPPTDANPAPLTPMTPFTPISPRYRMPSEKEQLRRRLLKLQRTLGEQITPGLVVRPKTSSKDTAGQPDNFQEETNLIKPHQRGDTPLSDHFLTTTSVLCGLLDLESNFLNDLPLTPQTLSNSGSPSSPSFHSLKHCLPETVALSPITLTAFAGSVAARSVTSITPSIQFMISDEPQDWSSEDEDFDTLPPVSPSDESCPPSPSQSECDSHDFVNVPHLTLSQTGLSNVPSTPGVRRREPRYGWSGEWNQAHIQDVIRKLRVL